MAITSLKQFNAFIDRAKRNVRMAAQKAVARGIGENMTVLRGTAPVDTKAYRQGINKTPVVVVAGAVRGKVVFLAEHSVWVHKFGYHEGKGRQPSKTGLGDILEKKIPASISKHMKKEMGLK